MIWHGTLAGFLRETIGIKIQQIGRCAFVRHKRMSNVRSTCAILVHVDDLLVFGSTSTVSEVFAALRTRFLLTGGVSDYLGIEFKISSNSFHVHHEAYVAKIVAEAGFGEYRPRTTPLTTDYTAADFEAPAGADPNTAKIIDFPHANGHLGYLTTHTVPWLLYAPGFFSSTSRLSAAIPDAPISGHRVTLARNRSALCNSQ